MTGSFPAGIGAKTNAVVQLVRQGHAVTHILATDLSWDDMPVPTCDDEQEPGTHDKRPSVGNTQQTQNCNQNHGGLSWPCPQEYPDCRGFVQGTWGRCWKACVVPPSPWTVLAQSKVWLELTVWPDSIALQLVWDTSILTGFSGTVTSTLTVGTGNPISSSSALSAGSTSLLLTEDAGNIVKATAASFPVAVVATTGTVLPRDLTGDVMLEVPTITPSCGYNNDCSPEVEVEYTATNEDTVARSLRLSVSRKFPLWDNSISQSTPGAEITGFSAVLLDGTDGYPTGIPLQISKNWHSGSTVADWGGYDGNWWTINSYTRLPPLSTHTVVLKIFYQTYGNVPAFSHAQLSIVGYSDAWLWEEAALYSGGESICFDPLGTHTRAFVTDVRPSLMDGEWKENVGGHDFLVYYNSAGEFVYLKAMDPQIQSSGPCLSNATYQSVTADNAIRSTVQVSGGRTDDWVRVFMHIRHEVLADTDFSRMAFFQFGADNYAYYNEWEQMLVGQGAAGEVILNQSRTCTNKDSYEGGPQFRETLSGSAPWWISLGPNTDAGTLAASTKVVGDKAMIVRSYDARLGGIDQSNPAISMLCDKVELNPPAATATLLAGDYVDIRLEVLTMPRSGDEYDLALSSSQRHGAARTLQQFSGSESWERVNASSVGHLNVVAPSARVESHYPVRVCSTDGSNGKPDLQVEFDAE